MLFALLLLAGRTYFPVPVCNMKANDHTHVRVSGRVALVKHEADGDTHIRLVDHACFVVAECIPEMPCRAPKVGQTITVQGISRFDGEHKWLEVHPVEKLTIKK